MNYGADLAWVHHTGFTEFARSAAPGVINILRKHAIDDGLVVDGGCGSGVLSRALTDAGYDVFGFDPSTAMIDLARETAPHARFEVASFLDVELPRCRAVLAAGEVLMYLPHLGDTFLRVHEALERGGVLLFDVGRRGAYPARGAEQFAGEDWEIYVETWLDDDGAIFNRRIVTYREGRRSEELHRVRLYSRDELTSALRDAGCRVRVRRSYGTRRLPATHDVYVATKG